MTVKWLPPAAASCLLVLTLLLTPFLSHAQLTLGAEIRPRTEFRDGFKTLRGPDDNPAFFVEQRSRLFAHYQMDKLELNVSFQDVRIWGATNQVHKTDPSLTNLFEGWARYHFSPLWSVKVGRQTIDRNNARFLGDLDWAQQSRVHDALLFIYEDTAAQFTAQVGGAFNQRINEPAHLFGSDYLGVDNYKTMQFVWINKTYAASEWSLVFQNDGRQVAADTSLAFRQTYGAVGTKKLGSIAIDGELYYQGGKNRLGTKVSAWLVSLSGTYKTQLTPITLGFDYLSGTDITDTRDHSFDPLYGTNHKFYGYMDYFYVGNFHGQAPTSSGLFNPFLKTSFRVSPRSNLLAHLHRFCSPVDIYDIDTGDKRSRNLGTELDLVFVHKFGGYGTFHLGYSAMKATESMELIKGRGNSDLVQHWAWAMLTLKPTLFVSKSGKDGMVE